MTKEKVKQVSKIIACIILSILIYSYLYMIFAPKSIKDVGGKSYYAGQGFMAEPEDDSIDVMVFGNSDAYSAVKPLDIYNKYGYTSFVSGAPWQSMEIINILLRKSIKKHSPKVVILEADCLFGVKSARVLRKVTFFGSTYMYHSRWKQIKAKDFYTYPSKNDKYEYSKGYLYSDKVTSVKRSNFINIKKNNDKRKLNKYTQINRLQLNIFIDICKKNNIKVFLMYVPSPSSWNIDKHNDIKKVTNKNNIEFIDLNTHVDGYKVHYDTDFRDNGNHLNYIGATRVTEFLGKYLNDNYSNILKDRRNEKRLSYWNDLNFKLN